MKHLLGLEGLSAGELTRLLDAAEAFLGVGVGDTPKRDDLKGKVVVNLFYEPSTRTRVSFGLRGCARLLSQRLQYIQG
jgi:aspartate carbamoyltransferase catalytic subunit